MVVNEKQRKAIDKLLAQINFAELRIRPNGDETVHLTFSDSTKSIDVKLNKFGRKV